MKVKCLSNSRPYARDLTVGKVYSASKIKYGSYNANGNLVNREDAIKLIDDVGDTVYTALSLGFEVIGDDL